MASPPAPLGSAAAGRPRPDVLAYPSPTTSRYLVFVTALLAAGLFVGNWFHLQVEGDEWTGTVAECLQRSGGSSTLEGMLETQRAETACMADAERVRTLYAVGGAVLAALTAAAVLYLSPHLVRRRRGLRQLGPALSGAVGRFDELAHEGGVAGAVRPLVGSSKLRDAFTFGTPGNYQVALPPALAVHWRNPALFDPAVRHELAHAAHRDVALAWLTRSVWWALVPVLALPILFAVLSGDLSVVPSYTWRAVTLGLVVALVSAALLRSREYGADLRAARWAGDRQAVEKVVSGARPVPGSGLKGLLANHPTPQERLRVLADPAYLARTGFVDGLTGAFLAALAVPLVVSGLAPAFTAGGQALRPYLLAALVLGPMLGASVGLALWRAALVARVSGGSAPAGAVAAGVGLGLVLGQAASLDAAGLGDWLGIRSPGWLLVTGALGAGTTVVAAGLGHVWADAAPRLPGIRSCWVLALVVNAALFSALLWSASLFQSLVESGGWLAGRTAMAGPLAAWPMFWLVVALGAVAQLGLALRSGPTAPGWLLEDEATPPWPRTARDLGAAAVLTGLVAGTAAAAVIVVYRLSQGPAGDDAATLERVMAYQWVIALGVAAAATVLVVRDPVRGGAAALAAGPVAAVTGTAGFLVLNVALGGRAVLEVGAEMVRPSLVIGFYLTLAVATAAYAGGWLVGRRTSAPHDARLGIGVLAAVLLLTGAAGGLALQEPRHLVGVNPERLLADADDDVVAADYVATQVPELAGAYRQLAATAVSIATHPTLTDDQRATLLVTEVAEPVRALADEWRDLPGHPLPVLEVHGAALRALALAEDKYLTFAEGYRLQDPSLFERGQALRAEEVRWWGIWQERVAGLRDQLAEPGSRT